MASSQPWFCVATGADGGDGLNRLQPAVVFNSQRREYLVVYMVETSSLQYEIRGKTISWNGSGANAEFPIEAGMSSWTPKVAYNPTNDEYLVAYNFYNTTGGLPGTPYKIFWAIVINDEMISTRIGWIDTGSPDQVDVAYNSSKNGYVLTYVTSHPATTKNDIDLIHLGSSGGLLNPPGVIHIAATANDENRPAIATDQRDSYMVTWQAETNPTALTIHKNSTTWATDSTYWFMEYSGPGISSPDISFNPSGNSLWVFQMDFDSPGISVMGVYQGAGDDLHPYFADNFARLRSPCHRWRGEELPGRLRMRSPRRQPAHLRQVICAACGLPAGGPEVAFEDPVSGGIPNDKIDQINPKGGQLLSGLIQI